MNLGKDNAAVLLSGAYSSCLAIDWISGSLYYTSKKDKIIYACSLPSALYCSIVIELSYEDPSDIVLHPMKGFAYL